MWESGNDFSSSRVHTNFNPEGVEKWIAHVANIKLPYLQLVILLSILKDIVESDTPLSLETISKIKNVVLFDDISEYVKFSSSSRSSDEARELTLLGIPKEFLAHQNLTLSGDEITTVSELVEEKLESYIRSIVKVFKLESGERKIMDAKWIKEVPTLVDNFVKTHQQESLFTFFHRYRDKLQSCNYEVMRMIEMSRKLMEERVHQINPCIIQALEVVKEHSELLRKATRYYSASIKKEILTPDTRKALQVINKKQLEEIEKKEDQIEILKRQLSEYESLYPEGFEKLLQEYLEVEKALENTKTNLGTFQSQTKIT